MAVTVTPVFSGSRLHIADVEATADADTVATIPHGLPAVPSSVIITPLTAPAQLSLWYASTIDGTNVVVTKATSVGSGGAGDQVRVQIGARPHFDR